MISSYHAMAARVGLTILLLWLGACAHQKPVTRHSCFDQEKRLQSIVKHLQLEENRCVAKEDPACEAILRSLERMTLNCPEDSAPHLVILEIALRRRDLTRARRHADLMSRASVLSTEFVIARARIAIESGQLDQAETILQQRLDERPDEAELLEMLAGVNYVRGAYYEAEQSLARLEELADARASVAFHRGLIHETCQRHPQAMAAYQKALRLDADLAEAETRLRGLSSGLRGRQDVPGACLPPSPTPEPAKGEPESGQAGPPRLETELFKVPVVDIESGPAPPPTAEEQGTAPAAEPDGIVDSPFVAQDELSEPAAIEDN